MLVFIAWLILLAVSVPLALLALVLFPLVWLLSIPFRILGIGVRGALDLVEGIVRLPVRLLRERP